METIIFYSYKGGAGRSLAIANLSNYLSLFGKKVCLLDFDLESPGLHYKFPDFTLDIDTGKGFVDYLYEYSQNNAFPESIKDYSYDVTHSGSGSGQIILIPAGNLQSPSYRVKKSAISRAKLLCEELENGCSFFHDIIERLSNELNPDYLLIDWQTGVTCCHYTSAHAIPDKAVCFMTNNRESLEGARLIIKKLQNMKNACEGKQLRLYPVLARIPLKDGNGEGDFADLCGEFKDPGNCVLAIQKLIVFHSMRELELKEDILIGHGREPYSNVLAREYMAFFAKLIPEDAVRSILEEIFTRTFEKAAKNELTKSEAANDVHLMVENYPYPYAIKKLLEFLANTPETNIHELLDLYHRLWYMEDGFDETTICGYVRLFYEVSLNEPLSKKFNLEVVEKYLSNDPVDAIEVGKKLTDAYAGRGETRNSAKCLKRLLSSAKEDYDVRELLLRLLEVLKTLKDYDEAVNIIEAPGYAPVIERSTGLKLIKLQIYSLCGLEGKLVEMFDDENVSMDLAIKEPALFISILDNYFDRVDTLKALRHVNKLDGRELLKLGRIFYKRGGQALFKKGISSMGSIGAMVTSALDREAGRR
jgi:MinD-like ATPase involved in chromosome partitioning or flagellar assembly